MALDKAALNHWTQWSVRPIWIRCLLTLTLYITVHNTMPVTVMLFGFLFQISVS